MKVFLNYAKEDAAFACRLSDALAGTGLEVADPVRDYLPGDNWANDVAHALEESEAMVVLLTPAAANSLGVQRSMDYALGAKNYSNRLIPVIAGDRASLPDSDFPWILRRMPWFELTDSETEALKVSPIAEAIRKNA